MHSLVLDASDFFQVLIHIHIHNLQGLPVWETHSLHCPVLLGVCWKHGKHLPTCWNFELDLIRLTLDSHFSVLWALEPEDCFFLLLSSLSCNWKKEKKKKIFALRYSFEERQHQVMPLDMSAHHSQVQAWLRQVCRLLMLLRPCFSMWFLVLSEFAFTHCQGFPQVPRVQAVSILWLTWTCDGWAHQIPCLTSRASVNLSSPSQRGRWSLSVRPPWET